MLANALKKRKRVLKRGEFSDIPRLSIGEHLTGEKSCLSFLLQLRDTYSKSGVACLTGEEMGNFLQNLDLTEGEDSEADPCWQVKWHLGNLIKKVFGNQHAETVCLVVVLFRES